MLSAAAVEPSRSDSVMSRPPAARSRCSIRALVRPAIAESFAQARPARPVAQPGDVRRLRRQHPHHGAVASQALAGQGEAPAGFILAVAALAVVHGAVRQLRRSARRRPQQGAGRLAARPEADGRWPRSCDEPAIARAWHPQCRPTSCARATSCWSRPATSIPADGEVIEGVASVDESAITGESAPVIRESGGDFSSVTGGTRVLSDWLVVRVTRQSRARPSSTA